MKKRHVGADLTEGPILKKLVLFAIPMILTNLLQQLYGMVDLIIIGQFVGSIGTVGVSTGGEIADFLTPTAMAVATAGQVYISQLSGAKDFQRMKEASGTMLTFMLYMSVVCMLVPIVLSDTLLGWMNCPPEAWQQAKDYMIICSFGMPFIFAYNGIVAMLRGIGESKRPLIFVAVAASVNIVTDLLFVVVLKMEASGTALATVLSQVGSCVAAFFFLNRKKEAFDFGFNRRFFKVRFEHLKVMLKLGVPQLIRTFCIRYSGMWVKANINSYGLTFSATYSVGNKILNFGDVLFNSFTMAGGAMIGQNLGARKIDRAQKTQRITLGISMAGAAIVAILCLLIPKPLFRLFTADEAVIENGVVFMQIMAIGVLVHAWASSYKCMSTGVGIPSLALAIGVLDGVSRILVCLMFVNLFNWGGLGYYWGAALCHVLPGLTAFVYYMSGKWKTAKLLSER